MSTVSPGSGNSDAHALDAIGIGWTTFEGRTAAELRQPSKAAATDHGGSFHDTAGQVGVFGKQLTQTGTRRPR